MALKNLTNINKKDITEEFLNKYISSSYNSFECDIELMEKFFIKSIDLLFNNSVDEFLTSHTALSLKNIEYNIPYVVLINELTHLQNIIVKKLIQQNLKDESLYIYELYNKIENIVAKEYFNIYTNNLLSTNNLRKASLNDMVDKCIVEFYSDHIDWLSELTISIKNNDTSTLPQMDKNLCNFGKWLNNEAKEIIKNNSKLKVLDKIHTKLHLLSHHIKSVMQNRENEYHILLTYLEKCELISLAIGTELALIDNTIINQKSTKDSLTGALGRQVLEQLFQNQYEISIATNNSFVIAICDLDNFKSINDTYGHLGGDELLKGFVKIVKNNIRSSDILIRYGGEEFVLLLPATNNDQAYTLLEKTRNSFENFSILFEGKKIQTTVSIGMVQVNVKEKFTKESLSENLLIADKKLYTAKREGRNKII